MSEALILCPYTPSWGGIKVYLLADFELWNAVDHGDGSILQGLVLLSEVCTTFCTHVIHHCWMCAFF